MMPEIHSKADIGIRLAGPPDLLGIARLMENQFFSPPQKYESGRVKGRKSRIRSVALQLKRSDSIFVVASMLGRINGAVYFQHYNANLAYSSNMVMTKPLRQEQPLILFKMICYMVERQLEKVNQHWAIYANFESEKAGPAILRSFRKLHRVAYGEFNVNLDKPKQSWLQRLRFGIYTQAFIFQRT